MLDSMAVVIDAELLRFLFLSVHANGNTTITHTKKERSFKITTF